MQTRKLLFFSFFFLFFLAQFSSTESVSTQTYFRSVDLHPRISIIAFTVIPSSINKGGSGDLAVTFRNTGGSVAAATATAQIFDGSGNLLQTLEFSEIEVPPGPSIVAMKSFSVGSSPVGIYRVFVNATYGEENITNTPDTSFTVVTPVSEIVPPESTTGLPTPIVPPGSLPPAITPIKGDISMVKSIVRSDIVLGQGTVSSISMKNVGDSAARISFEISGISSSWLVEKPKDTIVLPQETRVVNLPFSIPANAPTGDYLVKIKVTSKPTTTSVSGSNGNGVKGNGGPSILLLDSAGAAQSESTDYILLRVKNAPAPTDKPYVLRTLSTDSVTGKTTVTLIIRNPSASVYKNLLVSELIPRELALDSSKISFSDKQGVVSDTGKGVEVNWLIDLNANDELRITYSISSVLSEYSVYYDWQLNTLATEQKTALEDLLSVVQIESEQISAGGVGKIHAVVLYTGDTPVPITAFLEVPSGFGSKPQSLVRTLPARSYSDLDFEIQTPENSGGSSSVNLVILSGSTQLRATTPVIISSPHPATGGIDISKIGVIIAAVIAAIVLFFGLKFVRSSLDRSRYSNDRVKNLMQFKRMIDIDTEKK
ncbi:Uncharacterised protein [Candidatus Gugararchaeum adminiculabundum]|nr:Uncharacterised protein [Candidatus Gugararchaeum adminiculabundum]